MANRIKQRVLVTNLDDFTTTSIYWPEEQNDQPLLSANRNIREFSSEEYKFNTVSHKTRNGLPPIPTTADTKHNTLPRQYCPTPTRRRRSRPVSVLELPPQDIEEFLGPVYENVPKRMSYSYSSSNTSTLNSYTGNDYNSYLQRSSYSPQSGTNSSFSSINSSNIDFGRSYSHHYEPYPSLHPNSPEYNYPDFKISKTHNDIIRNVRLSNSTFYTLSPSLDTKQNEFSFFNEKYRKQQSKTSHQVRGDSTSEINSDLKKLKQLSTTSRETSEVHLPFKNLSLSNNDLTFTPSNYSPQYEDDISPTDQVDYSPTPDNIRRSSLHREYESNDDLCSSRKNSENDLKYTLNTVYTDKVSQNNTKSSQLLLSDKFKSNRVTHPSAESNVETNQLANNINSNDSFLDLNNIQVNKSSSRENYLKSKSKASEPFKNSTLTSRRRSTSIIGRYESLNDFDKLNNSIKLKKEDSLEQKNPNELLTKEKRSSVFYFDSEFNSPDELANSSPKDTFNQSEKREMLPMKSSKSLDKSKSLFYVEVGSNKEPESSLQEINKNIDLGEYKKDKDNITSNNSAKIKNKNLEDFTNMILEENSLVHYGTIERKLKPSVEEIIPSKPSSDEQNRHLEMLLLNELNYIEDLNHICKVTKKLNFELRSLLSNIDFMIQLHNKIYKILKTEISVANLSRTFLLSSGDFDVYVFHVMNEPEIAKLLQKQKVKDDKIKECLRKTYLRPSYYFQTFEVISKSVSSTDKQSLRDVIAMLHEVYKRADSALLLESVKKCPFDLRRHLPLIINDSFHINCSQWKKTQYYHAFLLDDLLILTTKQTKEKLFHYIESIPLTTSQLSYGVKDILLRIECQSYKQMKIVYYFLYESEILRNKWYDALSKTIIRSQEKAKRMSWKR